MNTDVRSAEENLAFLRGLVERSDDWRRPAAAKAISPPASFTARRC